MEMIKITLPDGAVREYPKGSTGTQIAAGISEGLARVAIAIEVNGQTTEMYRPVETDAKIRLFTWNDTEGKTIFWHSSAHIMAEAILEFYPDALLTIGPPIETGFYYDVDFNGKTFNQDDFGKIEKRFLELSKSGETFAHKDVSKAEALEVYKNNPYKTELIDNLEDGSITFYYSGNFVDLCRGPHIPNSNIIKAMKIMSTAGAYWRGNEKNKMLTRIYGVSFPKQKELEEHLQRLEEAKKRDHRKVGKELELFTFSEKVGMGLPLWLPKGARLRETLVEFLKKVQEAYGYQQVVTPHIGSKKLYETSGHWEKYGKDSFQPIETPEEGELFMLKPMNCPHHCEIYASRPRSYRELPLRLAEFGTVYRYEQSGELHGLTRVRGFTQDDAHIFCRPEQVKDEFKKVIDIVLYIFKVLKFEEYVAQISLRDPENPTKYFGTDEQWEIAEASIIEAAAEKGLNTVTVLGEAAFYGPKLDFMVRDAIGRKWQLGTIQVDYQLPNRFELEYIGPDNQPHRPVMIHRAPFGSLERFVAVLIEHTAGDFPLWLTPEQAIVLPLGEKYEEYAHEVAKNLRVAGIRAGVDDRNETVGKKIRDAEIAKSPFMLVVGEKEMESESVAVRKRKEGDLGVMKTTDFVAFVQKEIKEELA